MRVGIQKLLFMFGCRRGVWKEEGLHPMLVWFVYLVYSDYQLHTVDRRVCGTSSPGLTLPHPRNSEITFSSGIYTVSQLRPRVKTLTGSLRQFDH